MLIVGNEGWSYADKVPYPIRKRKYAPFSLPNQPQQPQVTLEALLAEAGIGRGSKIALFGWKLFDGDAQMRMRRHDAPYYLVEALFDMAGPEQVSTMNHVMIESGSGLRDALEVKELVLAELSGTRTSRAVYRALAALRPGMSELEASAGLQIDGYPLSMHPNVNFGASAFYGLASPDPHNALNKGDIACVGMAYRRALCHKVGVYVRDAAQLSAETRQVYERYFAALSAWYEALQVGTSGHSVYQAVVRVTGDLEAFGVGLNLGHGIHTEEWTSSPFYAGSQVLLRSGVMLQCDFSVFLPQRNIAVHAEDGLILADAQTRAEIEKIAPASYRRMCRRRQFLREVLGIGVSDEVLPTSDMPAVVFPCMADPSCVYANE